MCKHSTCADLRQKKCARSVGATIMLNYYNRGYVCFLGREISGNYANQYNVIGGKMEPVDDGCYLVCLAREVREECKFPTLNHNGSVNWSVLDSMFKGSNGRFHYFTHGPTPIFIGVVKGIKRENLRAMITGDKNMPPSFNEMSDIDFVTPQFTTIINGIHVNLASPVSSYANSVVRTAFGQVQVLQNVLPQGLQY
ncbi:MAG: hypothetical protein Terrestrivirus4_139 [Terrestrivirus sp.]|uniref:Nudix hydrolase domain-containing protein n=1 Tax=Terrestrivirus sp. TaxID=2487775 RepID=A0A3G4ZQ41_9VIRU|nr:MAG: hypothetical protein Terrestrivirus4_139 [Terrestrivirus sp.]